MPKKKFEFLEHPADIKIRVFGKDLSELFINAAEGMIFFLYGSEEIHSKVVSRLGIKAEADNLESLLVDWLSEILWFSDAKNCKVGNFKIEKLAHHSVSATVELVPAMPKEDIKAVTYHDLKIRKDNSYWIAEVVFDI